MSKEQAKEQINKLQEEIDKLQEIINRPEHTRWKPKYGEVYFFIGSDGTICSQYWNCGSADMFRYNERNVFRTVEKCAEELNKKEIEHEYFNFAEDSWAGEKIDWNNKVQDKRFHCLTSGRIFTAYNYEDKKLPNKYYFKSKESLDEARAKIGDENIIKYILEG